MRIVIVDAGGLLPCSIMLTRLREVERSFQRGKSMALAFGGRFADKLYANGNSYLLQCHAGLIWLS